MTIPYFFISNKKFSQFSLSVCFYIPFNPQKSNKKNDQFGNDTDDVEMKSKISKT